MKKILSVFGMIWIAIFPLVLGYLNGGVSGIMIGGAIFVPLGLLMTSMGEVFWRFDKMEKENNDLKEEIQSIARLLNKTSEIKKIIKEEAESDGSWVCSKCGVKNEHYIEVCDCGVRKEE